MLQSIFRGIFDSESVSTISIADFLVCILVSLGIGLFLAAIYTCRSRYTKSFFITLTLLPAIVCVIIMMVNGNVGTGVAVAGAFSLVRFRSAPGTAKEIACLFLAMGSGLITGMGYLAFAVLFALILGLVTLALNLSGIGEKGQAQNGKLLRITIPEDLNYTDVFQDIFDSYTASATLNSVKTTNMGSLFRLSYQVTLKDALKEKEFLDALRTRNGNLEISLCNEEVNGYEL
jgi:hypothetical protein